MTNQIEKMLEAILKTDNNLHWIGGYVYGRTSQDDPYILLYPASDWLQHKVCRVYDHQFEKLPPFIDTRDIPADTDNNPDKDKAIKKGIYHTCPAFKIVTFDGRETQMGREKRFSDTLYFPTNGQQQPEQKRPAPAQQPDSEKSKERWREQALSADNDLFFDSAMYQVDSWFGSIDNVRKFRELLFDEEPFSPFRTLQYLTALEIYAYERENNGIGNNQKAHKAAKDKALAAVSKID